MLLSANGEPGTDEEEAIAKDKMLFEHKVSPWAEYTPLTQITDVLVSSAPLLVTGYSLCWTCERSSLGTMTLSWPCLPMDQCE